MSPELLAAIGVIAVALVRELLLARDRRHRQRGELRTRDEDAEGTSSEENGNVKSL